MKSFIKKYQAELLIVFIWILLGISFILLNNYNSKTDNTYIQVKKSEYVSKEQYDSLQEKYNRDVKLIESYLNIINDSLKENNRNIIIFK